MHVVDVSLDVAVLIQEGCLPNPFMSSPIAPFPRPTILPACTPTQTPRFLVAVLLHLRSPQSLPCHDLVIAVLPSKRNQLTSVTNGQSDSNKPFHPSRAQDSR